MMIAAHLDRGIDGTATGRCCQKERENRDERQGPTPTDLLLWIKKETGEQEREQRDRDSSERCAHH